MNIDLISLKYTPMAKRKKEKSLIIPNELRIGGHTFKVRRVSLQRDFAETDFERKEIVISRDLAPTVVDTSLIHEIIHVINPTMDGTEVGHMLIESLSEQLYQALKDNGFLNLK